MAGWHHEGCFVEKRCKVCNALNSWRADTELEEFIWFCKRVAETHGQSTKL